ncbi:Uncharacterised protein [Pseudomonas aeruginosa]|nr:Uncharacterised protein [Pseudomonas aeruginosa]
MPWSTALRTRCTSGSARASTRFLSRSVSSPTSSRLISFFMFRARSRTRRGKRPKTFLIGCMRVFITDICRSPVTTSRLATALAMASSPLFRPRRTRRLRTSTSSPTMFMISSRRAVSTRTVVSASLAAGLSGAAGRAAAALAGATGFAAGLFAAMFLATAAAAATASEAPLNLPLPCSSSSSDSNSSSLISSPPAAAGTLPCSAGAAAGAAAAGAAGVPAASGTSPNLPLPCSSSSSASNSSSLISSPAAAAAGSTASAGTCAGSAETAGGTNLPLPCNWSSNASNSASLISSPAGAAGASATAEAGASSPCRASSNCSNSSSVISLEALCAGASGGAAGSAGGTAAGGACTGSAGSAPSGSARRARAASSSGVAGVGSDCSRTWSNIALTVSSACSTTSISSELTRRSPLRRISKTFSAMWQHSTSAFSWRKPAPPLTVWNPRKMALSRSISSGRLSSSTSCSDNCSRISPASTRKSWRISSSASKLIRLLPETCYSKGSAGPLSCRKYRPGFPDRLQPARRDHRHDEGCASSPRMPAFNAYLTAAMPQS